MVNGRSRILRGQLGEAASIRVNGENADMYTQVHNGDKVEVTPSTAGEAAALELGKLPELAQPLHVVVNGSRIDLPRTASVNGTLENEFYQIKEGDEIQVQNAVTVADLALFMDVVPGRNIRVNDTPAKPETKVYEDFSISWEDVADSREPETFAQLEKEQEETETDEPETFARLEKEQREAKAEPEDRQSEGEQKQEQQKSEAEKTGQQEQQNTGTQKTAENSGAEPGEAAGAQPTAGTPQVTAITVMVNSLPVTLVGKKDYVFVDIFSFIDFDLKASGGRAIVTRINGRNAEYMEPLSSGDVIEIYWK